ncbi:MAG: UDP-N-acetylglucosamine 2-epimerase (hydrolyzing) [Erysipelotrichia bacterium]|nr:UDP-N-acetylglucosamine 2-epimerase (hydrolyzing) [Erysipelotrichia bacterium]
MKKILAITAIRSDYDLMSGIYKYLHQDEAIELKLLVTGAHLSSVSGYSVKEIIKDNLPILLKIESLINADSLSSRIKSASIFLQNAIDVVQSYGPDLIIYAGDREETMVGGLLGAYLNIPTAHFFGGDHAKDGHVDNPVRHAVSKLSSVHFVTLEEHKQRLIKMGENAQRIFVVGNPSLDRFYDEVVISKKEIKKYFSIQEGFEAFALVIFHPITEEMNSAYRYFEAILLALKKRNICAFISYPNVDPGNTKIIEVIQKYQHESSSFYFYKNIDRNIFISIFKQAKFIIGNSSAGILEAASVPIPAINVGQRQLGRFAGENVVFSSGDSYDIESALARINEPSFLDAIKDMKNPYGDGQSSEKAYQLLKKVDFSEFLFKKEDPLEIKDFDA